MNHDECQLASLALTLIYLGWVIWLVFLVVKKDINK